MANVVSYNLHGPDITVRYCNGELSLAPGDQGSWQLAGVQFAAVEQHKPLKITTTTSENGIWINAVLLASDRAGRKYTLGLLLPQVKLPPQATAADVTGVAIVTVQLGSSVLHSEVLQWYEVRALSGTAALADTASA
jgi:hypothetical protein